MFSFIIKNYGSLKYIKYSLCITRPKGFKSKKHSQILVASTNLAFNKNENSSSEAKSASKIIGIETKDSKESIINSNSLFKSDEQGEKPLKNEDVILCKPHEKIDITIETRETQIKQEAKKAINLINVVKSSDLEWHKQEFKFKLLLSYYKSLSKYRLTGLVVLTTLAGYGMAPGMFEPTTFFCSLIGTGLMSAAANAINQILEVPYDSQMTRTKNRVLIRGLITPLHAFSFAVCSASLGLSILYYGTCTLTTALGLTNLILYTSIYTPLKRCSILNTWVGSIVGAIPPLIGWSACTGTLNSSALLMAAILYSWQFPHFNALSWNLRPDYSKAGYRMTSVVDPDLCRSAALRHSIALLAFCSSAPILGLTTWTFAIDSLPLNSYLIYSAWNFYKNADSQSSRKLFHLSLIYLPSLMFLMFIGKNYNVNDKTKEKNS